MNTLTHAVGKDDEFRADISSVIATRVINYSVALADKGAIGKPIIDRVLNNHLSEKEAIKCLLVSFDSTIKSNISVGTPIDLFFYKQNSFSSKGKYRVEEGDEYFEKIKQSWSDGIRSLFNQLP